MQQGTNVVIDVLVNGHGQSEVVRLETTRVRAVQLGKVSQAQSFYMILNLRPDLLV